MQQSTSNRAEVFSYSKDFRSHSASTYVKKHFAIKLDGGRTKLILKKGPAWLPEPEQLPVAPQPARCPADGKIPQAGNPATCQAGQTLDLLLSSPHEQFP